MYYRCRKLVWNRTTNFHSHVFCLDRKHLHRRENTFCPSLCLANSSSGFNVTCIGGLAVVTLVMTVSASTMHWSSANRLEQRGLTKFDLVRTLPSVAVHSAIPAGCFIPAAAISSELYSMVIGSEGNIVGAGLPPVGASNQGCFSTASILSR